MDRALFVLWKLRWCSHIRRIWLSVQTPLGAMLAALYLLMYVTFMGIGTLLFATDNLCFLLFPVRFIPTSPADIRQAWRHLVGVTMKIVVTIVTAVAAVFFGGLAYWLSGWRWQAFVAAAWLVILTAGLAIVPCAVWRFRELDVSVDLPSEAS